MDRKKYWIIHIRRSIIFIAFVAISLVINAIIYGAGKGTIAYSGISSILSGTFWSSILSPVKDINMQALWIVSLITSIPGAVFVSGTDSLKRMGKLSVIFLPAGILLNTMLFTAIGSHIELAAYFGGGFSLVGFLMFYLALGSGPAVYLSMADWNLCSLHVIWKCL